MVLENNTEKSEITNIENIENFDLILGGGNIGQQKLNNGFNDPKNHFSF